MKEKPLYINKDDNRNITICIQNIFEAEIKLLIIKTGKS